MDLDRQLANAESAYNAGNYNEATALLENVLVIEPINYLYQQYLGQAYYHAGQFERAMSIFQALRTNEEVLFDLRQRSAEWEIHSMLALGKKQPTLELIDKYEILFETQPSERIQQLREELIRAQ